MNYYQLPIANMDILDKLYTIVDRCRIGADKELSSVGELYPDANEYDELISTLNTVIYQLGKATQNINNAKKIVQSRLESMINTSTASTTTIEDEYNTSNDCMDINHHNNDNDFPFA